MRPNYPGFHLWTISRLIDHRLRFTSLALFYALLSLSVANTALANDAIQLPLDEGDGIIAQDIDGTPTPGLLIGNPAYESNTPDGSDFSLRLDGIDDYIDLGSVEIEGAELTVAAWFKVLQYSNSIHDSRIVTKASSLSANSHFFMLGTIKSGNTTRIRGRVRVSGTTHTLTAKSENLLLDTWYHGAMTYDGTRLTLFVNGNEVANRQISGVRDTEFATPLAVGAMPGGGRYFNGLIDQIKILPEALDSDQIAALSTSQSALIANDDSYRVAQDGLLIVNAATGLLSNDSFPPLTTLELVEEPSHGAVILDTDNSFTFIPAAGFSGSDNFTYRLVNGSDVSNTATVTIRVNAAPPDGQKIYISSAGNGTVTPTSSGNTLSFRDEDIIVFDSASQSWAMFIDGSDIGLTGDIDALTILPDGTFLFSLAAATEIAGIGQVDDSDIIRFVPTSTGESTSGSFEVYFDGSDVGLTSGGEDISALTHLDNGDLLISTIGNTKVPGVAAADEDLLRFSPTQIGIDTIGSWSFYFDGSEENLGAQSEDIRAVSGIGNPLYLATAGPFSVDEVTGNRNDILLCQPTSPDGTKQCQYSSAWKGNDYGFHSLSIDALFISGGSTDEDSQAPIASPTFSPEPSANNWYNSDVSITFNWSENTGGSGLDIPTCDSTAVVDSSGVEIEFSGSCSDLAGNIGRVSGALSIDRTAPVTVLTRTPPLVDAPDNATFEFLASDNLSGVSAYECQLDGQGYTPCVSPWLLTNLNTGSHTLNIRARDLADNLEVAPATYTWIVSSATVDALPPVANPIITPMANLENWHNSDVTIAFTWIDNPGGQGIDINRCTESLFLTTEGEAVGYSANCTDLADNTGVSTGNLSIDKSAPETLITNTSLDSETGNITIQFEGFDALSGIGHYECSLDSSEYTTCNSPRSYTSLANGEHTFSVRAVDKADNTDSTASTHTWYANTLESEEARASRFLQMAALGATDADIEAILNAGTENWLDNQLNMNEPGSRFEWMIENGFANPAYRKTNKGFDNAVWNRLFTAQNSVAQRWTLVLSELFVINPFFIANSGTWEAFAGAAYLDLLETHGLGSYRELLEEVTLSHQMGAYLSMRGSKKADGTGRAPDENYAREILQLFSIGLYELNNDGTRKTDANGNPIETYTNADIEGLAAAFTGWQNDFTAEDIVSSPNHHRRRMVMQQEHHENGEIRFLGNTIPANTSGEQAMEMALDVIANHPNVGPFLARQFIQRLVTSNPTHAYVNRVASIFNHNENGERGNLKSVLRAILLDPEANGSSPVEAHLRGKLREPMLRFIQWGRTFNLSSPSGVWYIPNLSNPSSQLAQSPLRSPSVFNFFRPGYVPPNTELGNLGLTAPELQITTETSIVGYANFLARKIENGWSTVSPDYSTELSLAESPELLLNRLNLLLTANQLTPETYNKIVNTIDSMSASDDQALKRRVVAAILMVMVSPDYLVFQ